MKFRQIFAPLGFFSVAILACAANQKTEPGLTAQEKQAELASFEMVWSTIQEKHWDPSLGGLDWEKVHAEYRQKVANANSQQEIRNILGDMIDLLGQSHFDIFPASIYAEEASLTPDDFTGTPRIWLEVADNHAVVSKVDEASDAYAKGIRPGWEVLQIGEKKALQDEIPKLRERYAKQGYAELRLSRALHSFMDGPIGKPVTLVLRDLHGKEQTVEVSRMDPKGKPYSFGNLMAVEYWFESRQLADNIGYIAFSGFFNPPQLMKSFSDAMQDFWESKGIIIDLRGNPGGIGALVMGMSGWFIGEDGKKLGTMHTRDATINFIVVPRVETYAGPLAILVDEKSASTAEIFAEGMKDLGRARIFGRTTAGAALPAVIERLPNGDRFMYAVADYVSVSGRRLEGQGVEPDEKIEPTLEQLLQGQDPVIEAAASWILSQKQIHHQGE